MRSYFLQRLATRELAEHGLAIAFPDQADYETKVVFSPDGENPIAWLCVAEPDDLGQQEGPYLIAADYSGRFWDFDVEQLVVEVLRHVQGQIGGVIRDDDGNEL
jgi:hypothetical protein